MAPGSKTSYHVLPRDSEDYSDREDSNEFLLPSPTSIDTRKLPKTHSMTANPCVILRFLSGVLAFAAFMLLVLHNSGNKFISADVFLMLIVVMNIIMIPCHTASSSLQISVEFRGQLISLGEGSFKKPNISSYLDLLFSVSLLISLLVGWTRVRHYDVNDAIVAGSVLGYIVIGFQVIVAIPMLDQLTFKIKAAVKTRDQQVTGSHMIHRPDIKGAPESNFIEPETTAIPEAQPPTTQVDTDLV